MTPPTQPTREHVTCHIRRDIAVSVAVLPLPGRILVTSPGLRDAVARSAVHDRDHETKNGLGDRPGKRDEQRLLSGRSKIDPAKCPLHLCNLTQLPSHPPVPSESSRALILALSAVACLAPMTFGCVSRARREAECQQPRQQAQGVSVSADALIMSASASPLSPRCATRFGGDGVGDELHEVGWCVEGRCVTGTSI
jgi:hypothetical protein